MSTLEYKVGLLCDSKGYYNIVNLSTGEVIDRLHRSALRRPFPYTKVYVPLAGNCFECVAKDDSMLCERLGYCTNQKYIQGIFIKKDYFGKGKVYSVEWKLA